MKIFLNICDELDVFYLWICLSLVQQFLFEGQLLLATWTTRDLVWVGYICRMIGYMKWPLPLLYTILWPIPLTPKFSFGLAPAFSFKLVLFVQWDWNHVLHCFRTAPPSIHDRYHDKIFWEPPKNPCWIPQNIQEEIGQLIHIDRVSSQSKTRFPGKLGNCSPAGWISYRTSSRGMGIMIESVTRCAMVKLCQLGIYHWT